jgi:hypothetical protein
MRRTAKGSLALTTIDAFMAVAAYESFARAGAELGVSPTTTMRRLLALEGWLHRPLIDTENFELTKYGDDFAPRGWEIIQLIERADLRVNLSKTRVHPDGLVTIEGQAYKTPETDEIGRLLINSRADISKVRPAPQKVSPHDPAIIAFLDNWALRG